MQRLGDVRRQATACSLSCKCYGARKSETIRAAVAFYHYPGKADHAGAVVSPRVEPGSRSPQDRSRDEPRHLAEERCGKLRPQAIGDQMGSAFHGLQRHIARETIGHNDVDVTREDVVSLDETNVVEPARTQQRMRRLH